MFRDEVEFFLQRTRTLDATYGALTTEHKVGVDRIVLQQPQPTSACVPDLERGNGLAVARSRDQLLARHIAMEIWLRKGRDASDTTYPGMVFFPSAVATIGVNEGLFQREEPSRTEKVNGFWIDAEPVTNGAYEAAVGRRERSIVAAADNAPIVSVNWFEAQRFCAAVGKRLPTRIEWEYAARGSRNLLYSSVPEFDSTRVHAWPAVGPRELRREDRRASGLVDMSGNVWEWTWEIFRHEYEAERFTYYSMIRGGSWRHCPLSTRVVSEMVNDVVQRADNVGFRCVIPVGLAA